jgi:hypothetical protein
MKKLKHLMNPATGSVATEQNWRKGYEELVEAFNDPKLMCLLWHGCSRHAKAHTHLDSDWDSFLIEVEQDKNGAWTSLFPKDRERLLKNG